MANEQAPREEQDSSHQLIAEVHVSVDMTSVPREKLTAPTLTDEGWLVTKGGFQAYNRRHMSGNEAEG